MICQGSRVAIRPMTRADLEQMAAWRPFANPLYEDANWPLRPPSELTRWYERYKKDRQRRLYALVNEAGQVIGSITLREIKERRSARLGITLGADFVDQGYGSEALGLFLDYYFEELGFAKMVLDVAGYNQRAIRVYEKLGFIKLEQREKTFSLGKKLAFLKEPRYTKVRRFFRRDWFGRYRLTYYEMELTRKAWKEHRADDS